VTIGVAGKYVEFKDAYKSIGEALLHGGLANNAKVVVKYLDVEDKTLEAQLLQVDGILIPGGFGDRGVEGKIAVAKFAREHQIPFLGFVWACNAP
jgi:CTP synthase